jgi:hypothetical protein
MNTAKPPHPYKPVAIHETPMVLFQSACLVMGSYRKAERWFESMHPLLNLSPKNAQTSPAKAQQLGALMEALSKGWPL